jgi:hypothetical protein
MWTETLDNRQAVQMFEHEPALDGVTVSRLVLDQDGPTAMMAIQLHEYPPNPPTKWRMHDYNAVAIQLQAMGIEHVELHGWASEDRVSISIDRLPNGKLRIHASGPTADFELICGWLRVAGVTPYRRAT